MKAFKVICQRFYPGSTAYYSGETASKARYAAYMDIDDVNPSVRFQDIQVLRAPEFDFLANHVKYAYSISALVSMYSHLPTDIARKQYEKDYCLGPK